MIEHILQLNDIMVLEQVHAAQVQEQLNYMPKAVTCS